MPQEYTAEYFLRLDPNYTLAEARQMARQWNRTQKLEDIRQGVEDERTARGDDSELLAERIAKAKSGTERK